jgi:hypothetical protein
VSNLQARLAARPPVPHGSSCHLCRPPERSLVRGVLWALGLEVGIGLLFGVVVMLWVLFS